MSTPVQSWCHDGKAHPCFPLFPCWALRLHAAPCMLGHEASRWSMMPLNSKHSRAMMHCHAHVLAKWTRHYHREACGGIVAPMYSALHHTHHHQLLWRPLKALGKFELLLNDIKHFVKRARLSCIRMQCCIWHHQFHERLTPVSPLIHAQASPSCRAQSRVGCAWGQLQESDQHQQRQPTATSSAHQELFSSHGPC